MSENIKGNSRLEINNYFRDYIDMLFSQLHFVF